MDQSPTGIIWNHTRYFQYVIIYIYATHDQQFPSESEERAAFWVGFGEHCGDAMTYNLLDKITQQIIYRSAVRPITKANPNHRLESTSKKPISKVPTVFIRSRQDDADPSIIKPMPEFDPDDWIGRTLLLRPEEKWGEADESQSLKESCKRRLKLQMAKLPNINFILVILVRVRLRN